MTQDEIQAVALKPCPFCGNDGSGPIEHALHVSHTQNDWHSAYDCYSVQCDKCTVSMGYSDNEAEAIAAWNTRADAAPTPKADEVEAVARAIDDQLTAEDGWMVGTPALSSMCHDFAQAAIAALDAARGDPVARVVEWLRKENYRAFTDGMEAAAQICGSLAEVEYDDADGFDAATGCEAAIMRVVKDQRREQAALGASHDA